MAILLNNPSNFRRQFGTLLTAEQYHRPLPNVATFPFKPPLQCTMESSNHGKVFIDSLVMALSEQLANNKNKDVSDMEDFDNDRSQSTMDSVEDPSLMNIYGHPIPTLLLHMKRTPNPHNEAQSSLLLPDNASLVTATGMATQIIIQLHITQEPTPVSTAEGDPIIPKTRSLAHHELEENRVVFVLFDIETSGEY